MFLILKSRLQNYANGDYLYFYQIYSLELETLGAYKIVILRSTSLKFQIYFQTKHNYKDKSCFYSSKYKYQELSLG